MIAWLALVLALLNTLAWVGAVLVSRKLYVSVRPMLQMMGLGSSVDLSAGPPAGEPAGEADAGSSSPPAGAA